MSILTAVYLHLAFFVSEVVFCLLVFACLPVPLYVIINSIKCGFSRYDFKIVWSPPEWWSKNVDKMWDTIDGIIKKNSGWAIFSLSKEERANLRTDETFVREEGIIAILVLASIYFLLFTIVPAAAIYGILFLVGLSLKYAWWLWIIGICGYLMYRYADKILPDDSVRRQIEAMKEAIASLQSEQERLKSNPSSGQASISSGFSDLAEEFGREEKDDEQ
ncbi:MAG: hypothetical protein WCT16_05075 [Candidatus Buchananbacteria bacterium]